MDSNLFVDQKKPLLVPKDYNANALQGRCDQKRKKKRCKVEKSREIDGADFSFFRLNSKLGHRLSGL